MKKTKKRMSYERKKSLTGLLYISPWIVGFVMLFAIPLIQSLVYTFCHISVSVGKVELQFAGFENYVKVLRSDANFVRHLTESVSAVVLQVPLILVLSLIIAVMLNQKFRGRMLMRSIFFLPVIIASGVVISIIKGDAMSETVLSGSATSVLFQTFDFQQLLYDAGLPTQLVSFVVGIANSVFELIWRSGIQILLFIAGLQTVSPQLYEVAHIEGASSWESFWKITFPMIGPMLVVNLVYSVADAFTDYSNVTMAQIVKEGRNLNMEISATMAWVYFLIIFVVLAVVYKLVDKRVSYIVD